MVYRYSLEMINLKSKLILGLGCLLLLLTALTFPVSFKGDVAVLQSEEISLENFLDSPAQSGNEIAVKETGKMDLRQGLASYWRLDQVKASKGYSIEFDGADDALRKNPFEMPGKEVTISLWMRGHEKSGTQYLFSYAVSGSINHILLGESGDFWMSGGTHDFSISSLDDGRWHHVVVTADVDNRQRIFIDGSLADEVSLNESQITSGGSLVFGQDQDSIGGSFQSGQAYEGELKNIRIYNRTLTTTEIQNLYKYSSSAPGNQYLFQKFDEGTSCDLVSTSSCLKDDSKNNRDLLPLNFTDNKLSTGSGWIKETPINTPSATDYSRNQLKGFLRNGQNGQLKNFDFNASSGWTAGKIGEYALEFDGKDDQVLVSDNQDLDIEEDITVSAWARFNDSSDYRIVVDKRGSGAYGCDRGESGWFLRPTRINDGEAEFIVGNGTCSWDVGAGRNWDDGEWHHYVATRDVGNKLKLYVDGNQVGSATDYGGSIASDDDLLFGGSQHWNGSIDDVRIYERTLSEKEVSLLYNGESVSEGLVGRWNFESGDRTTAYDTAGSQKGVLGTSSIGFEDLEKQVSVPDQKNLDISRNFTISTWAKPKKSSVFFEGFESGTMDAPWDNINNWRIYPEGWEMDVSNHDSHCSVPCNDNGGDPGVVSAADKPDYYFINDITNGTYALYLRHSVTATSPKIDLSGASGGTISGYWKGASQDGQSEHSSLEVYDGSSWVKINCIEGSNDGVINNSLCSAEDDGNWHRFQNNITQYLNKDFKIQFTGSPGSYDYTLIDNVQVKAPGAEISSFSPAVIKGGNGDFGTYSIWASPSKVFGALGSPNEAWNKTNETGIYAETSRGWKNIVMTFQDSSDLVKIYVNGELVNQTQKIGEVPTSQEELRIGHRFKGKVDEVRIYNRSLSKKEIQKLNFK